jgi:hypothetical protein
LDQADLLANKEPRRPKQASLRRAISAAYYALFHLIAEDSANVLAPPTPAGLRKVIRRAFQHAQMKNACKEFVEANTARQNGKQSSLPASVENIIAFPLDPQLIVVLTAFVELQEARHKADYDLSDQWNRLDVLNKIHLTRQAFLAWSNVRSTANVSVLVSGLVFRKEWGR